MIRGTIYVYRVTDGKEKAFEVFPQYAYREWIGCWAAI